MNILLALLCILLLTGFSDTDDFNKQLRDAQQARSNPIQLILLNLLNLEQQNNLELKNIRCKLPPIEDDCLPPLPELTK